MNANEVIIGNYIIERNDNMQTVDMLAERAIGFDNMLVPEYECNPIPLTEAWLLKFGFGMLNKSYFSTPPRTRTNNSPYSLIYTKDLNGDWYILINESVRFYLEHVHQLQNLYFALTGEELTINER